MKIGLFTRKTKTYELLKILCPASKLEFGKRWSVYVWAVSRSRDWEMITLAAMKYLWYQVFL